MTVTETVTTQTVTTTPPLRRTGLSTSLSHGVGFRLVGYAFTVVMAFAAAMLAGAVAGAELVLNASATAALALATAVLAVVTIAAAITTHHPAS